MDNQLLITAVAILLGLLLAIGIGATGVWLIFRSKARHFKEAAKSESAAEFATLQERLASKNGELQGLREVLEKQVSERGHLVEQLRAETDQRSAAEQKASRISSLESELAVLQEHNATLRSKLS